MKKLTNLIAIMLCAPALLVAQEDSKYLAGAVPTADGKVVFQREFDLPGATKDRIYDRTHEWIEGRMAANANNSRIVYADKEKGQIAATAEEYLVFSSSALSLDRSLMNYQLTVTCQPEKCLVAIERIRYNYQDDKYSAEEWIADEVALNKDKTKILRGYSKARKKTIDFAEEIFDNVQNSLGIPKTTPITQAPTYVGSVEPQPAATVPHIPATVPAPVVVSAADAQPAVALAGDLSGYREVSPDKIPGNIIKMLRDDWMLVTAGNDEKFNMMTASWGGLGMLYGKPVATCFINPARYTWQLMETNDTYTFSFYTEAYREALQYCGSASGRSADKVKGSGLTPITTPEGSKAFAEAWLIIECRKLVAQPIARESISDPGVSSEWAGKEMHKMYIGEIINVWVK